MLPGELEFDCVQVRVNVPLNAPSYCPDHVPERSTAAAEGLVTGGLVVDGETASGLVATVGDGELFVAAAADGDNGQHRQQRSAALV